jgi:CheY-like chemotaxis protein
LEKDSNASQKETYFAPAARAGHREIERQAREALKNPIVERFLKSIQGYLLVLNEQRQILTANKEFLDALGNEDPNWFLGLRPGEILNCRNFSEGPDGCGTSLQCRSCGAVLAILASSKCNAPSTNECCITIKRGESTEKRYFKVNASPVGEGDEAVTLFSILDVSAAKQLEILEEIFLHDILNTLGNIEGIGEPGSASPEMEYPTIVRHLKEEICYHRSLLDAEKGTLQKRGAWASVDEVIAEFRDILEFHSRRSQRSIHYDVNSNSRIFTDKVLLVRVLLNMAVNAIEASSKDDAITIRYQDDGRYGVFSVHNIGVIPESNAAGIFTRTFSTKNGRGHGLGTYSMKLLGEQHLGGEVSFTSSAAEGTVFKIKLPLNPQPMQGSGTDAIPSAEKGGSQEALLIDDMEQITILGKIFLERAGYKVTAETDAEEAVSLFKKDPGRFGFVITDMTMPKMSGLDVAREIRALNPQVPIILCTGYGDTLPEANLKDAGITMVLLKPVSQSELVRVVKDIMSAATV